MNDKPLIQLLVEADAALRGVKNPKTVNEWEWVTRVVLEFARQGNWEVLADHISSGAPLNIEVRKFMAGVLRGQIKRPNKRPPTVEAGRKQYLLAEQVVLHKSKGLGTTAAVNAVAEAMGLDDTRATWEAWRVWGKALWQARKTQSEA